MALTGALDPMYEQAGFEFVRRKGMKNTVMRRTILPA